MKKYKCKNCNEERDNKLILTNMNKNIKLLVDSRFRRGLRLLRWYQLSETEKIDKIEQLRSDLIWARYLWIFFACMLCYAVSLINY